MPRFASVNEDLILEVGGANDLVLERNGVEVDRRGAEGFGKVLQVVTESENVAIIGAVLIPLDDTIPQITEGVQVLTVTLTPNSLSSRIRIQANLFLGSNATQFTTSTIFKDSDVDAICTRGHFLTYGETGSHTHDITISPNTLSPVTISVRVGADTGAVTLNGVGGLSKYGASSVSTITLTEIGA